MFRNITLIINRWMVRFKNINISTATFMLPIAITIPRNASFFKSIFRNKTQLFTFIPGSFSQHTFWMWFIFPNMFSFVMGWLCPYIYSSGHSLLQLKWHFSESLRETIKFLTPTIAIFIGGENAQRNIYKDKAIP